MQAKWHNLPFKLAKLGAEAGLPPVGFTNANLMVTLGEIELGKPLCPPRLVEESVNRAALMTDDRNNTIRMSVSKKSQNLEISAKSESGEGPLWSRRPQYTG